MRMYSQTHTHTHCAGWDFFQRIRPQSYSFVMPSRCLVWGHRLWITSLNLQPNRFWSIYVVLCPSCPLQGSAKIGVNLRRFYLMDCFSYSLLVMSSGCGLWACRGWYVFMDAHGVAQCGSGPNLRVALSWGFDLSGSEWMGGWTVHLVETSTFRAVGLSLLSVEKSHASTNISTARCCFCLKMLKYLNMHLKYANIFSRGLSPCSSRGSSSWSS